MILMTEKGKITLPKDFRFEITTNHPFFSDDGTASAPVTLPSSARNREMLDFPDNLNRRDIYGRVLQGFISHNAFSKPCKIIVDGSSQRGGISASIALRESEMYADIQDVKLPDIFTAIGGGGLGNNLELPWYYYANRPSRTSISTAFTFFPVACDKYEDSNGTHVNVINRPNANKVFIFASRNIHRGSETIAVPSGYGLAPYFYLSWVLQAVFRYFGYGVRYNAFKSVAPLDSIVLLHPYTDLLTVDSGSFNVDDWKVDAGKMVPTITVGELLTFIRDKFGAFVSVVGKEVSIRLFNDVAQENPDFDLTSLLREDMSVTYPERATLAMTQGCDIDTAAPAAESLLALRETYRSMAVAYSESDISGDGLFHVLALGKMYQRKTVIKYQQPTAEDVLVGTEAVTFRRTVDGIEAEEEISPDDSYVPMVCEDGRYMPYIGESVHSKLETDGKEKGEDVPIMLCYAKYYNDPGTPTPNTQYCQGQTTSFNYRSMDRSWTGLCALCPEGLVTEFWEEYWKILASGAPEISCRLALTLDRIGSLDLFTPKLLDGTRVLIKSLKYDIGGGADCEAVLQLLPMYDDIPEIGTIPFDSSLVWGRVNTCAITAYGDHSNGIEILETDGLTDYTDADAPTYTVNRVGVKAKVRKRWLRYKEYRTIWWENIFQPYRHSERTCTYEYQEYFISQSPEES